MANISDEVNRMIIDLIVDTEFSSASPGHINHVLTVGQTTNPDFEELIETLIKEQVKIETDKIKKSPTTEEKKPDDLSDGIPSEGDEALKDVIDARVGKNIDNKIKIGFREAFADTAGGQNAARNVFAFAKNPTGVIRGITRALPFIGGIVVAAEFAQAVHAELDKIDKFFKKFIPDITNLHNQLREREESARVAVGEQQLILTVRSGQTSPRLSYNSFNGFNTDSVRKERLQAIRDNSGVD
jgi:hypothetical protein